MSKHSHDDAALDAVALVETFLAEDIEGRERRTPRPDQ